MGKVRKTVHLRLESIDRLRSSLEEIYHQYGSEYLPTDPLCFVHRYPCKDDQEVVAFLAATLAFGNVKAIFGTLERLLGILGEHPTKALRTWKRNTHVLPLHRWVSSADMDALLTTIGEILRKSGSIENYFGGDGSLANRIHLFSERVRELLRRNSEKGMTRGLTFLFPSPKTGSGCKRINLFLRWVVRSMPPDLGLWKSVTAAELYLPVDVHLERICRYIGLTRRRTTNWRMVEEVTSHLRHLDAADPIRFDFSLSRLGILDRCIHKAHPKICPQCPLQNLCILNAKRLRNAA
jgi:uncharacterized protein (TIGR02757 family)